MLLDKPVPLSEASVANLAAVGAFSIPLVCEHPFHQLLILSASCIRLRQAGTWDSVCIWTHLFSSNKIQRSCMGLKTAACRSSWIELWTRRYKETKKSNCPF